MNEAFWLREPRSLGVKLSATLAGMAIFGTLALLLWIAACRRLADLKGRSRKLAGR
jgi:hypothetical protein